ncbi:threonine-phosphate decarboxylase CobD [Dyella humicola]|uniref:threonine-phosphate decarboxylase CobD n=1 Tax=Dyella humicola TaxID=2992126 RepID=UPI00224F9116|nr:threonine-phosphate decarboxylase CobD [Dyella humicola]
MLEHGGRLQQAAITYGIALPDWLDLSTGISPFAWPVPEIPAQAWHRLPEDDDGLVDVAQAYYHAPQLLPVAGSQAAIQALPSLRGPSRVGVIAPGYNEHAHAWRRAGHEVTCLSAWSLLERADELDVIVLIHPNNPGGERFQREALLACHARLRARGGWLIVDEAFMDVSPDDSLCPFTARDGLVVLRSVGKFFGLAGIRAGFVCTSRPLLDALRDYLGPWTLSGPTRHVLKLALADRDWQAQARGWLRHGSARLAEVLLMHAVTPTAGCAFFHWWRHELAPSWHHALAERGILTRLFDEPRSLRFGLPADEAGLLRLDQALASVRLMGMT